MTINWREVRAQFPVTEKYAYLNTAAAGPLARATTDAASEYYRQMMADGDSGWDRWLEERERVRSVVAKLINAEPDEIGFTTNTSSGMNLIVDALEGHGEVISCELEFPVSTIPWMHRRIPVHLVKATEGVVLPDDICRTMNSKTGVISISHVQFSNGYRMDLEELGRNKGNHALVVNAAQSAGAFAIDVKRMGIDALCSTGHKWLLAGYGTGFVYLSRALLAQSKPLSIGWLSVNDPFPMRNNEVHLRHDTSSRAELGCPHFAGIFALGASVTQMLHLGQEKIEERVLELNGYLTTKLASSGWRVISPLQEEKFRSAETLVSVPRPADTVAKLKQVEVAVTEKPEGIRVATHFFNDEEDVERLLAGLGSADTH